MERSRILGDRLASEMRGLPRHPIAGCNNALTRSRPRCRDPLSSTDEDLDFIARTVKEALSIK